MTLDLEQKAGRVESLTASHVAAKTEHADLLARADQARTDLSTLQRKVEVRYRPSAELLQCLLTSGAQTNFISLHYSSEVVFSDKGAIVGVISSCCNNNLKPPLNDAYLSVHSSVQAHAHTAGLDWLDWFAVL